MPGPDDLPPALPDPPGADPEVDVEGEEPEPEDDSVAALLKRLKRLEEEVQEVKSLRERVSELESELESLKSDDEDDEPGGAPSKSRKSKAGDDDEPNGRTWDDLYNGLDGKGKEGGSSGGSGRRGGNGGGGGGGQDGEDVQSEDDEDDPTAGYSQSSGSGSFSPGGGGGGGPNSGGTSGGGAQGSVGRGERVGEREPLQVDLRAKYKYNFAGGFFQLSDPDGEFVINLQNIITWDGAFHDRQNPPTDQQGFNVPFQRLYLYGNITKNWEFQISEQASLGEFNLLDLVINVHYDDRLMLKFGRFLAPFYYQDYATFPMLVPPVTYSALFQFSAQRQPGVMAWGKLFENRIQYQAGAFTGIPNSFFDLDNNVDFIGSLTFTPFMASENEALQNFGFGVSTQVGRQNFMLNAVEVPNFIAGAGIPFLNQQFVTASNVPFFIYNEDVRALGQQIRVAPHLFYYGRASFLSEYVFQQRALASPTARGNSVQHGFYALGSYFLTGERYTGDGTGGFPTIMPERPFNPTNNEYGPGAHELAFQYTLLDVGDADIRRGFADPIWATRLSELMVGYNWWPNKYVRIGFHWSYNDFNRPIPWPVNAQGFLQGPQNGRPNGIRTNPISEFNVFWFRVAMFF